MGTSVDVNHPNYELMYDMINGIRVTVRVGRLQPRTRVGAPRTDRVHRYGRQVSRCQAKPGREPVASDFTAAHKLAFDM
jgi:hypothetical protein